MISDDSGKRSRFLVWFSLIGFLFFLTATPVAGSLISGLGNTAACAGVMGGSIAQFFYRFRTSGILEESGSMASSDSPCWWLNSGAVMILESGIGRTLRGSLPSDSYWRNAYRESNARDTDDGAHPQNLFRLITRGKWRDYTQHIYVKIMRNHLSSSPERSAWSGILLFNRYIDGYNLYYAGVRMDGHVVVKKKQAGRYYTLAENPFFTNGRGEYDRETNPTLLPQGVWFGLKTEVINLSDGSVRLKLFIDKRGDGNWELALQVTDDGRYGSPIRQGAHAGIRTDYMDVLFNDFRIEEKYWTGLK